MRGAVRNVEHEGVTGENGVHGTDRALEMIRTRRKTKSSSALKGIGGRAWDVAQWQCLLASSRS